MDNFGVIKNIIKTKSSRLNDIETTADAIAAISSFMIGSLDCEKVKKEQLKDSFKIIGVEK